MRHWLVLIIKVIGAVRSGLIPLFLNLMPLSYSCRMIVLSPWLLSTFSWQLSFNDRHVFFLICIFFSFFFVFLFFVFFVCAFLFSSYSPLFFYVILLLFRFRSCCLCSLSLNPSIPSIPPQLFWIFQLHFPIFFNQIIVFEIFFINRY